VPTPARFRSTIASIVLQPEDLRDLRTFHRALADVNRLRIVRRVGRETICTLRPEAFGEVAAREREILGIAS